MPLTPDPKGPTVSVAVLCEAIVSDTDGATNLVRVVEEIVTTLPATVSRDAAVLLNSGDLPAEWPVTLSVTGPDGYAVADDWSTIATLSTTRPTTWLFVPRLPLRLSEPGMHWLAVVLAGRVVARQPFVVRRASADAGTPR